jgi:hypothetical protein
MSITRRTLLSWGGAFVALGRDGTKVSAVAAPGPAISEKLHQLFAWAIPADVPGSPVDHTWVTSYDNRITVFNDIQSVLAAKESFWYAWGNFHPKGGTPVNPTGYLGSREGTLGVSDCTASSNADCRDVPSARGTIFAFGVDGVCHQLTNQILYSTRTSTLQPVTVSNARGY